MAGAESYTYHSKWLAESPEKYQPATRRRLVTPTNAGVQGQNSAELKASTYLQARRQLDLLRREIRKVFANIDLLILPTLLSPPATVARGADPTIAKRILDEMWERGKPRPNVSTLRREAGHAFSFETCCFYRSPARMTLTARQLTFPGKANKST